MITENSSRLSREVTRRCVVIGAARFGFGAVTGLISISMVVPRDRRGPRMSHAGLD